MQEKLKASKPTTYNIGLIKLNEWRNERETKEGRAYTAISYNMLKSYKSEDDVWKDTSTFTLEELRVLHRLITNVLFVKDSSMIKIDGEQQNE